MNSKNLIFIIFLYGLLISYFMGYSLYNNNQLRNSLVFVNQEERGTEKEEKNEKKVKDNKQENKKEAKTEEQENNNPNEIIYPTFFLDNKKTMIGCQCLIETIVCTTYFLVFYMAKRYPYSNKFKNNGIRFFLTFLFFMFTHFHKDANARSVLAKSYTAYLIIHMIVSFLLALIFKFTSKNSYWYLLKNYWKSHFNNLGSCFIFLFNFILWPVFSLIIDCLLRPKAQKSKKDKKDKDDDDDDDDDDENQ